MRHFVAPVVMQPAGNATPGRYIQFMYASFVRIADDCFDFFFHLPGNLVYRLGRLHVFA